MQATGISPQDLDTADALGAELITFVRVLHRARARFARSQPEGLEQPAFAILATLVCEGPQRTSALAETLHSEISTVSRQSSALVQLGLLERQADPEDGRACLLAPTSKGKAVFEHSRDARNRWLATTVADWDPADVDTLTRLLTKLNTDLARHELPSDSPRTTTHDVGGERQ